jgi:putative redox protein
VTSSPRPEFLPAAVATPAAPRRHVRGLWQGSYRVELEIRDGRFTIASDQGPEDGGEDGGPVPSELLFSSVASCFAMAVVWSARRRRMALPDLEVTVSWGYDKVGRMYDDVTVVARSSLATEAPEQFGALVRLAEEVCWVTRSIRNGRPITVRAATRE